MAACIASPARLRGSYHHARSYLTGKHTNFQSLLGDLKGSQDLAWRRPQIIKDHTRTRAGLCQLTPGQVRVEDCPLTWISSHWILHKLVFQITRDSSQCFFCTQLCFLGKFHGKCLSFILMCVRPSVVAYELLFCSLPPHFWLTVQVPLVCVYPFKLFTRFLAMCDKCLCAYVNTDSPV